MAADQAGGLFGTPAGLNHKLRELSEPLLDVRQSEERGV
jgi:hypothetical protein